MWEDYTKSASRCALRLDGPLIYSGPPGRTVKATDAPLSAWRYLRYGETPARLAVGEAPGGPHYALAGC